MPQPHVLFYTGLLVLSCSYALLRGGRAERVGATIILVGSIATRVIVVLTPVRWRAPMPTIFLVDMLACAAFFLLMRATPRTWPILCFGAAAAGAMSSLARAAQWKLSPIAYYLSEARWGYVMILALLVGTWRSHRVGTTQPS